MIRCSIVVARGGGGGVGLGELEKKESSNEDLEVSSRRRRSLANLLSAVDRMLILLLSLWKYQLNDAWRSLRSFSSHDNPEPRHPVHHSPTSSYMPSFCSYSPSFHHHYSIIHRSIQHCWWRLGVGKWCAHHHGLLLSMGFLVAFSALFPKLWRINPFYLQTPLLGWCRYWMCLGPTPEYASMQRLIPNIYSPHRLEI